MNFPEDDGTDEGGIVRCTVCGRAVPCRRDHEPTPIDPADIRPGDVVERRIVDRITVTGNEGDRVSGTRPDGTPAGLGTEAMYWAATSWYLVSRPDPDAEAVEALDRAGINGRAHLAWLREQGWDLTRRQNGQEHA